MVDGIKVVPRIIRPFVVKQRTFFLLKEGDVDEPRRPTTM